MVKIPVDTQNFFDRSHACDGSVVPCSLDYPYIFPDGKLIPSRIPTVNMAPFSQLSGGPYPSHSSGPIYTASDSFTWVKRNHTFKFGFMFERSGENDNDEINVQACPTCTNNQNGQFLFTDKRSSGTGVAVANAALGLFDTYSEIGHRAYTIFRSNIYEAFAQDSWKISHKLTMNYGVAIHRHRSLPCGVGKHDPVRSPVLRSRPSRNCRSRDWSYHRVPQHRSAIQRNGHSRQRIPARRLPRTSRRPRRVCTTACSMAFPITTRTSNGAIYNPGWVSLINSTIRPWFAPARDALLPVWV